MKLLLYCTKSKPYLIHESGCYDCEDMCCDYDCFSVVDRQELYNQDIPLNETYNGKIVGECDFEVQQIKPFFHWCNELEDKTCLSREAALDYLDSKDKSVGNPKRQENVNLIHIKNLNIFYTPKELSEYYSIIDIGGGMLGTKRLTKAPQNIMHISINQWEYCFYNPDDINILISIKPEWLCKILNGEKTIEIRKKVLKEML